MRCFNVEGACNPEDNYMVDITQRLETIKSLIEKNKFFCINRARQYGKTTTLNALEAYLQAEYCVISLDFQFLSSQDFQDEFTFVKAFVNIFVMAAQRVKDFDEQMLAGLKVCTKDRECTMSGLFQGLSGLCAASTKPVVLIIDEVDNASNNQVFLDFLGMLRAYYLHRKKYATFQSVILAGVYDIKRLQQKIRPDAEHRNNSPWNIAAEFDVDMSLSVSGIKGMLKEYESDWHTGMCIDEMAELLYAYTSGYPFLVSRLCKLLDEKIAVDAAFEGKSAAWSKRGILAAEKLLLAEKNTLFESLNNKLNDYPKLREILHSILFSGTPIPYNQLTDSIEIAAMFGFIKNHNGNIAIANRIFESLLYNLFLAEETVNSKTYLAASADKNKFVQDGILNMDLVMEKFMQHWNELYSSSDEKFIEENGRKFFLLYLKPIINGVGNYYIEAQTRDNRRTDVIVDYRGKQYIIEIKIWRGNEYNERGEIQLADYLKGYHASKGYLLSFNFNKRKKTGMREVICGDKVLVEVVV